MRSITPELTPDLKAHCGNTTIWKAPAFRLRTFPDLVQHAARLAYLNHDDLLFFRGQNRDYQSKAGGTTLYPSIYRGDALSEMEVKGRFDALDLAASRLVEKFSERKIEGHRDLRRKRYIQWSILQHYEVVATPCLDVTHSLRVACSFARMRSEDNHCFLYILGLPYLTNRVSINSERDLVNVRLLSICPPSALRPYFQEGYVTCTADITSDFESKTELDYRNRLIAKFEIPTAKSFWGSWSDELPETALYPRGDQIFDLCNEIKTELPELIAARDDIVGPSEFSEFLRVWADLESRVLTLARRTTSRNLSMREAIKVVAEMNLLSDTDAKQLNALRSFRNVTVHQPNRVQNGELTKRLADARKFLNKIPDVLKP